MKGQPDHPKLREVFAKAVELPVEQRSQFLDEACGESTDLREQVESLLSALAAAGGEFLADPTVGGDPPMRAANSGGVSEGPGTVIGRYKLLEQIGEGGFGVVFMAEQEAPIRRRVALKIIKLGMDTKQIVARFEAERQALAMMDHSNIAKVFDGGATEAGRPYFVMELVRGISITDYCDQHTLPVRRRLELFAQVCQAVQHAHQKGIIHRDLKPTNVLVADYDDRPVPKVIDFGVAKAIGEHLTEKTMFTQFGQIVGTVEYMSPEQAKLNQLDIDTRTDIYSLGVLLYQLLTGETPFDRQRLRSAAFDEMLRIIRDEEPPKPSTRLSALSRRENAGTSAPSSVASIAANRHTDPEKLNRNVQGELDWIVMKALEKDRNRRYETAIGFARDIQRYLADEAVEASPPSAIYKLRKFARRHRTALRVTAAFVLLLLSATVFSSWEAIRATRAKAEALAQKNRTDEQAAVAEGVNQFFSEEVFGLADPKRLDPAGITLVQALDVAASKVDTRFPNDPRLRAEIRARFGEIYIGIDRPQQAIDQLQKAIDLRTATLGAKDPITMRILGDLGWAVENTGRYGEARDIFEKVLADQTQVLGAANPDTIQTASQLALVLMSIHGGDWGPSPEALDDRTDLDIARNAYQSALRALGPRNLATLNAEHQLSQSLRWGGKTAEALGYAREASIGLAETRGRDDPNAMWASYNYAACLSETGHPDEAVNELQPVLAVRYRILGPTHMDTLHTAWRLAMTLRIAGKPQQAFAVLEEVQAHLGDVQAPHSWQRGQMLSDMAECYRALGRLDRAAEFLAVSCKMADVPPDEETQRRRYASWLNDLASDFVNFPARELRDVPQAVELATRACELTDYQKVEFVNTLTHALTVQGRPAAADAVYSKVISVCRQAIVGQPNSPDLYIQLGDFLEGHQKLPEAEAAFTQAIRLKPDMGKAWAARGECDRQMDGFAKMAEDYSKASTLQPDRQWYWHEIGYAYMRLGDNQNALAAYSKTIELGDTDSDERFRRGEAYRALGELSEAQADYSRAIELNPINDEAWAARGDCYGQMDQFSKMADDYSEAIKLAPNEQRYGHERGYAYIQLGRACERLGELSDAEADYSRAIELDPKNDVAWYRRAWAHEALGQYENAVADYTSGMELRPDVPPFWMSRADCWTALGQLGKAAQDRARAIALLNSELISNPNDVWANNNLARLLATAPDDKLHDPKRAVELAEKDVQLAPAEGDIWNTLGAAHYRAGEFTQAINDLEKSISLTNGGNSYDFFFLAMAHYQLGHKDEARTWQAKAVEWMDTHKPKNPELLRFRAEAVELLGIPPPIPTSAPATRP